MPYDLGDVLPFGATVYDDSVPPQLANAGSMKLLILLPDQTTVTIDPVTPVSTGVYEHDYPTTMAGRHQGRWVATGANQAADPSQIFDVREAYPAYLISLPDMKAHLNLTGTSEDEELRGFIEAATRSVEHYVGPVVVRTVVERHRGTYVEQLRLWQTPVVSVTSVASVLGTTTYATAEIDLDPVSGAIRLLSRSCFTDGPWNVTYKPGRAIIGANISSAARIIVQHLWETQRIQGGRRPQATMSEADFGGRAEWGRSFSIPRRALELLEPDRPILIV